jgi:hypothetical protein
MLHRQAGRTAAAAPSPLGAGKTSCLRHPDRSRVYYLMPLYVMSRDLAEGLPEVGSATSSRRRWEIAFEPWVKAWDGLHRALLQKA